MSETPVTSPDIPTTTLAEKWDNSVDAHKAAGATGNPWRGVAVDMYHEAEDLERRLAIACKIAESVERLRAAATAERDEARQEVERLRGELLEWQTIGSDQNTQKEIVALRDQLGEVRRDNTRLHSLLAQFTSNA